MLSDNIILQMNEVTNPYNLFDPMKRRRSIDEVHKEGGITGKHVNVAVIDSYDKRFPKGIQKDHEVYNSLWNIVEVISDTEKSNESNESDHALKMAAIIGGRKAAGSIKINDTPDYTEYEFHEGIAPNASVTIYLCSLEIPSIIRALKKVCYKKEPPFDIISMSIGLHLDRFSDIIQEIKNECPNIIIVAAGGNGGNWWGVQYPAKLPDVIGVGALDTNFNKWACTAKGPEIDIYDCGVAVSPKAVPQADSSKAVSPKAVSPKAVSPKEDSSKAVSPKAVSPKAVSPKAVSPKEDFSKAVSPKAVSPKAVSPKADSSKAVSLKEADSSKAVSPKAVSPKAVSPKADSNESLHRMQMFETRCGTSTAAARITGTLCLFLEVIKRRAMERNEPTVNINKEFMLELLGNVIWIDGGIHYRDLRKIITWKNQFLCKLDHCYIIGE